MIQLLAATHSADNDGAGNLTQLVAATQAGRGKPAAAQPDAAPAGLLPPVEVTPAVGGASIGQPRTPQCVAGSAPAALAAAQAEWAVEPPAATAAAPGCAAAPAASGAPPPPLAAEGGSPGAAAVMAVSSTWEQSGRLLPLLQSALETVGLDIRMAHVRVQVDVSDLGGRPEAVAAARTRVLGDLAAAAQAAAAGGRCDL